MRTRAVRANVKISPARVVPVAPLVETDVPALDAHRAACRGALRACHSQDYHVRVVLVAPLAESDVPALELFVRATAKITMREWFWWLHLPSPMFQRWSSSCVSQPRLPCESGSGGSTCRVRCSSAGALRACHSQDYHARVVLVAPLAESDVPALELFVRATAKITMREWFWWLHLPSPMFQRWSSSCVPEPRLPCESGSGGSTCRVRCSSAGALRACHSEDYHARVVPVAPLAESDVPALELFVRATAKITMREWFWWLHLPSPMFQRWSS
ncbi:hypothetical protein MRX96_010038 [Rhipicephalus microplus]